MAFHRLKIDVGSLLVGMLLLLLPETMFDHEHTELNFDDLYLLMRHDAVYLCYQKCTTKNYYQNH